MGGLNAFSRDNWNSYPNVFQNRTSSKDMGILKLNIALDIPGFSF